VGDFDHQVALVTGAGRGLGRLVAEAMAARGAAIAANDITPVNLDLTLEHIRASGGQAKDYIFDVGKLMPVQTMVDQVLADWGRIDVLVSNARVQPRAALLEMDEWDWNRTLEVNLSGAFLILQQVAQVMRRQGGGSMVIVAPLGIADQPGNAAFLASQAALVALARQAAFELAPYNIRVNAVRPAQSEAEMAQVVERICYLCSQAAAHISGQIFESEGHLEG
jgi:NAD(P)-dependent dehydrogenase (short-subunit alcohol dehydrogenase family)